MKTSNGTLPAGVTRVLTDAEALLAEHDGRMATLSLTDAQLRTLLVERISQEQAGNSDAVAATNSQREALSVKRVGLLHLLSASSSQLRQLRVELERELADYARDVIAQFSIEYNQTLFAMQGLWRKADAIEKLLRVSVPCPPPMRIATTRKPDEGLKPWPHDFSGQDWLERIMPAGAEPPTLDPNILRIGAALDHLDVSVEFTAGIVRWQAQVSEFAHSRLMDGFDSGAVYRVSHGQSLIDPVTGFRHEANSLLDSLVVPAPLLARAFVSRSIVRSQHAR
jgi:hypothetical protein